MTHTPHDLLPCPFCGGAPYEYPEENLGWQVIACGNCGAMGPYGDKAVNGQVGTACIEEWNARGFAKNSIGGDIVESVAREIARESDYDPDDARNGKPAWTYFTKQAQAAIAILNTRAPVQQQEAGWQDIETLPDDITEALVYSPNDAQDGGPCITSAKQDAENGWRWWEPVDGNPLDNVTHWMLLPTPPAEKSK